MVLNIFGGTSPTSSIYAFIVPNVVEKENAHFSSNSKYMCITDTAQTGQEERDVTNHTNGINQTARLFIHLILFTHNLHSAILETKEANAISHKEIKLPYHKKQQIYYNEKYFIAGLPWICAN